MIIPPYLHQGSTIGVVPPAGKVNPLYIDNAKQFLEAKGYKVLISDNAKSSHFQYAGTDEERLNGVQQFLNDQSVNAILFARGGYGTIRIIDKLDFTKFQQHPKWLIGFSDITIFHAKAMQLGIASIHSPMSSSMNINKAEADITLTMQLLEGKLDIQQPTPHLFNKKGCADGILTGGNLSLVYALRGTPLDVDPKGKILFIEDLNEYLYHLDRMMHNLKLGGILENISGLVVGQFSSMKDNDSPFGQEAYEIILEAVKEFSYPVIFDYPAGHIDVNYPLIFGKRVEMEVGDGLATIRYQPILKK